MSKEEDCGGVFLDLNGTLVLPNLDADPANLHEIPGAAESIARLNAAGLRTPVITNQSRISKGFFTETDFLDWFKEFRASWLGRGAQLEGPYVCPHHSDDKCDCRKPRTTLYLEAAKYCEIDPHRSFVIGDSVGDIKAGETLGAKTCLVRTGSGEWTLAHYPNLKPNFIAKNLNEAVNWVVSNLK